jgi:hypothetical protein
MPRSSTLRTSPWSSKKVIFSESLGADGARLAAGALPTSAPTGCTLKKYLT